MANLADLLWEPWEPRRDAPPHQVLVIAHHHTTDDAGLDLECTAGHRLRVCSCSFDEPSVSEAPLGELNAAGAAHLATHEGG